MSDSTDIETNTAPQAPAPAAPVRSKRTGWIAAAAVVLGLLVGAIGITAAVVSDGDDDDDETSLVTRDEDVALLSSDMISRDRASTLAIDAAGGGTVTDLDVDDEGGTVVYEIEVEETTDAVTTETDVVLDARTGEVIRIGDS